MSHLTASPFHKPGPLDVPRAAHPLTPPDTESEFPGALHASTSTYAPLQVETDGSLMPPAGVPSTHGPSLSGGTPMANESESPGSRFRRVSTLAYRSSGLRDTRDRTRSSKSMVVVIPPTTISQQHGMLGSTLSSGPAHRLSHGILMPLFPTMYGQLSAIAREFNFPSTAGLCIYLHVTEGGVTVTPRVSDDTWQILWAHIFDARSPSSLSHQLPVCGRIEFDVDLRKARWYDMWLSAPPRETADVPRSVASRAPSIAATHTRVDSRTTFAEENSAYEQVEPEQPESSARMLAPAPGGRRIPRQLSLVNRFDSTSLASGSRAPSRTRVPNTEGEESSQTARALVPINHEDEPQTAKQQLERRVNSWRASATLAPTALAVKGQTSLEPANMPNNVPLENPVVAAADEEDAASVLNLEDFTWSISSAGPASDASFSLVSPARVPSVHLDRRNEGSVCLTPTTCTSFGPADYDPYSPISSISRVPSIDLGMRMVDDAPMTPMTCTSFGPEDYDPYSPISSVWRAPSVDLGMRMLNDAPATPLTATSWGAPSYFGSPMQSDFYAQSVDLGHRGVFSRPATPSTATSWGAPLSYPASPATPFYVQTPDAGQRAFDPEDTTLPAAHNLGFPYYSAWESVPWSLVWPYNAQSTSFDEKEDTGVSVQVPSAYPHFVLYPACYPHFDLYPAKAAQEIGAQDKSLPVTLSTSYPTLNIYPAVYPHFDLYPRRLDDTRKSQERVGLIEAQERGGLIEAFASPPVQLPSSYPYLVLYPACYPHLDLYPAKAAQDIEIQDKSLPVTSLTSYPTLNIYPAVHPHFDLYPSQPHAVRKSHPNVDKVEASTSAAKPWTQIWPYVKQSGSEGVAAQRKQVVVQAVTATPWRHVWPYDGKTDKSSPVSRSMAIYPHLVIYPPVYPHFDLYPTASAAALDATKLPVVVKLRAQYPQIDLYPAVYPDFDLYPVTAAAVKERHANPGSSTPATITVKLPPTYPGIELYADVYPWNLQSIYPARSLATTQSSPSIEVNLPVAYPSIELYAPVYPWNLDRIYPPRTQPPAPRASSARGVYPFFDLCPAIRASTTVQAKMASRPITAPSVAYPVFNLYPAVYPYFDLYPALGTSSTVSPETAARVAAAHSVAYPVFNLYPAVYPHFDLYPPASGKCAEPKTISVHLQTKYPNIHIYRPIYPYFDIHHSGHCETGSLSPVVDVRTPARYPHFELYPCVYPHFSLYPPKACHMGTKSQKRRALNKRTHAELHAIVMMEDGNFLRPLSRLRKSHHDLHTEVFPGGWVPTPSGERYHSLSRSVSPPKIRRALSTRRAEPIAAQPEPVAIRRSRSGSVLNGPRPRPPSQISGNRLSTINAEVNRRSSRPIGLPSSPAEGRQSSPSKVSPPPRPVEHRRPPGDSALPVVREDQTAQNTSRTPSVVRTRSDSSAVRLGPPSHPIALDRASSLTERHSHAAPRKRDSLVLQRVRAMDGPTRSSDRESLIDSFDFPMPPAPPVPKLSSVTKLDRSKYPFA